MQDFEKLKVWQNAHRLTLGVYQATHCYPKEELFGLTSQMRRASSSIGANIAEGCGRVGTGDLGRFLSIALGSASELQYHLRLSRDLSLLKEAEYAELAGQVLQVKKMIAALIERVRSDN